MSENTTIAAWFGGRLPESWFVEPAEVTVDRDEILVIGRLAPPDLPDGTGDDDRAVAERARIDGFREDTREQRIRIARAAETEFARTVSWGARCGDTGRLFTHLSIPAMTRLRIRERSVLDTLVAAGVARSRSDALGWCVRLVARHQGEWLADLDEALRDVAEVRNRGPVA